MRRIYDLRNVMLALVIAGALSGLLVACTASAPAAPVASAPEVVTTAEPVEDAAPTPVPTSVSTSVAMEEPVGDQATLVVQLDDSRTLVRKVDFTCTDLGAGAFGAERSGCGKG